MKAPAPDFCPQCGAEVPPKANACPECGSCPETGWSDSAGYDALDLPDQEFDYGDYARREFDAERKPRGISWWWWVVGLVTVAAFLGFALSGLLGR